VLLGVEGDIYRMLLVSEWSLDYLAAVLIRQLSSAVWQPPGAASGVAPVL
jgi:hypothetical protein